MEGTVLQAILDVCSAVGTWITETVAGLVPMFYAEGSLTFIGVLAVAGLAISVAFLLINIIRSYLRFQ